MSPHSCRYVDTARYTTKSSDSPAAAARARLSSSGPRRICCWLAATENTGSQLAESSSTEPQLELELGCGPPRGSCHLSSSLPGVRHQLQLVQLVHLAQLEQRRQEREATTSSVPSMDTSTRVTVLLYLRVQMSILCLFRLQTTQSCFIFVRTLDRAAASPYLSPSSRILFSGLVQQYLSCEDPQQNTFNVIF